MKYKAITIDTQVVYANNRQLDGGSVAQLEQYKDGPIKFVLSEIVLREINALLVEKAKAPREALEKAVKDGTANRQLTEEQSKQLEAVLATMDTPNAHAKKQLVEFIEKTGAEILAADTVAMKTLLQAYFGGHPPFSNKGKKSEFPDAISLIAIENWAKSENKIVLAVSNDGDWKSFAEKSNWIDCVDDLSSAMGALLEGVEAVEAEGRAIVQHLIDKEPIELRAELVKYLERATADESPHVEFESSQMATEDYVSLSLKEIDFHETDANEIELTIVRVTEDGFVMRVPLILLVNVEAEIEFYWYDSIDREDVPMGSSSFEREVEVEAYALMHYSRLSDGEESAEGKFKYSIDDAELVDFPRSIEIGYVEHSLADDDHDFDLDDWPRPDDGDQEDELQENQKHADEQF